MVNLSVGTLLEHIGFSQRARIHRLAEIAQVRNDEAVLYIDNDPNPRTIERFELLRWWEAFKTEGEPLPAWVKNGVVCRARDRSIPNRAVIHSSRPGWVSFFDHTEGHPHVFRIVEFEKFHASWVRDVAPSIWERLLEED